MSNILVLERELPLPPAAVWRAWTEPELLKRWFCPLPWQTVEADIDLQPGGAFGTVMQGPDGTRMAGSGCFLVVDAPHRLVWTSALGPGYTPQADFHGAPLFTCELRFEALPDGGTRYTARAIHANEAGAQRHAEMGFHDGWGAALGQLVTTMQAQMKGPMQGHIAEG
jgi:uncharacterized protein YndB with AHSA1/START domain